MWEVIKGNIRNETIKYAAYKKKIDNEYENQIKLKIESLENNMISSKNDEYIENIKKQIDEHKNELNCFIENKINGLIIRSKATIVEFSEKNSRYFANLEKKRSESKTVSQLNIKGKIITNTQDILNEEKNILRKTLLKKRK